MYDPTLPEVHALSKRVSSLLIDTTGDGFADARIEDTTGDGKPDTVIFEHSPVAAKEYQAKHKRLELVIVRGGGGFGLGMSDTGDPKSSRRIDTGRVTTLAPGGAAEQAGVMLFDKVTAINGKAVKSSEVVPELLKGVNKITLQLERPLAMEFSRPSENEEFSNRETIVSADI